VALKTRVIEEFVGLALHRGWAAAPRTLVASWYEQQKFSKGVITDLRTRSEDDETFGAFAVGCQVFRTPGDEILLVRKGSEFEGD
jgi:hypothetical protein